MLYKSIEDIFNSSEAIINDPYYIIHQTIQLCNTPPELEEYVEFLNDLDHSNYPKPKDGIVHHSINPLRRKLKPVSINYK